VVQPGRVLHLFVLFSGWGKLAAVISVATSSLTWCADQRHRAAPYRAQPAPSLRVPGLPLLAPMAFVLSTLMLFWPAGRTPANHAAADSAAAGIFVLPGKR